MVKCKPISSLSFNLCTKILTKASVAPRQYAPADLRADAQQVNLELVDRRQAVIADSGR